MKWLKNIQSNAITFSICFILFLIIGNGVLDLSNRSVQSKHDELMNEAMRLEKGMNDVFTTLKNSDLGFRGFYIIPNQQLLHPYINAVDSFPNHVDKVKLIMATHDLNPTRLAPVEKEFTNYFKLVGQMVEWRKADKKALVDSVVAGDPGYNVWKVYDTLKKELDQDMNKIILESQAKTNRIMFISTTVRISLFVLGIPTLLILLFRLNRERKRRMELFVNLEENNRKYLFNPNNQTEATLDEKRVIDSLITNLSKATDFISNIAKGNFETRWDGLTAENLEVNKANLAGELLQMKEQMIKVKQEDKVRMWATEGLSKFAELVRQNQDDVQELSDKITSTVAKYMNANQASLFFVEDKGNKEMVLKLSGCYAYDRKKFLQKTIAPGEGLVGQTYLEKETIYLTNLPQDYVTITSGLGEATPASLVIVPLKFNEQVEGILELASFNKLQHYELEFLQKIGEIIASAILSLRSSTEMKHLMENLQYQSEEMKAQEEEMRQNMEELQATQEEMARKAREYQQIIEQREIQVEKTLQENQELKALVTTLQAK